MQQIIIPKISKNFSWRELLESETAKAHGIDNSKLTATQRLNIIYLVENYLQPIRDALGEPITITSGFRSPELNKLVGGSITSAHPDGRAVDFTIAGDVEKLFYLIKELVEEKKIPLYDQLIFYKEKNFIHLGMPVLARGEAWAV